MIKEEKIEQFISKFPSLLPVAKKLNEAKISWIIGGSSCLFLLGNDRVPGDVDIFILDNQHDKVDKLFGIKSFTHRTSAETVRNSNPGGEHSIQFTSHVEYDFDKHYKYDITETVLGKVIKFTYEGQNLYLLPPEDVLSIKALLQRGPAEGKRDIEDINNFLKIYKVDKDYVETRIKELGAENRVKGIF
jgi:predicted nucleotidyltransferase